MKITRRRLFASMAATIGGVGVYSWRCEPRWLTIQHWSMPIKNLDPALVGKTVVQISDLHVGHRVENGYLKSQFEKVESLDPDFIFYTGDFVDYADSDHLLRLKKLITFAPLGKLGTAGVIGNHDYLGGGPRLKIALQIENYLNDMGINVLRDNLINFHGLTVAGLEDLWSPKFRAESAKSVIQDLPRGAITLAHNPDTADAKIWGTFDGWILCGHTHGGQCRIPLVGAPYVPVQNKNYVAGEYQVGKFRRMYINRGVGHTVRVRFNSRPEITLFTLEKI